jgi:predicted RecA/RadA family phage recombinase
MARTFVQAGRRRDFTPTVAYPKEYLIFNGGFYGVSQDNALIGATGRLHMIILDGVWDLPNAQFDASIALPGAKIYAVPDAAASGLTLYKNTASLAASAVAIGELWATAAVSASLARVVLFGPENQY